MGWLLSVYIGAAVFGVGVTLVDLFGLLGDHDGSHDGASGHEADGQVEVGVPRPLASGNTGLEQIAQLLLVPLICCLHGDGEHAVEFAKAIREALSNAGLGIRACG